MMFNELFEFFGGRNQLAGALNVTTSIVYYWEKQGKVSADAAVKIEILSEGKYKAVNLVKGRIGDE